MQSIVQVDAFTNTPYRGNPAAVCVLEQPRPDEWMQNVAAEMNLAETAFLHREDGGYRLRWFTPRAEVDLCGHATLASAHALWENNTLSKLEQARFHTRSGLLTADWRDGWIELDFPATAPIACEAPADLLRSLGDVDARYIGHSRFDLLVELESAAAVRALEPDLGQIAKLDARGVIVTARSDDDKQDFVSRFFAPKLGVPEDPVTGSAHCCLAVFWGDRLQKTKLIGYQASERGGTVRVERRGERVLLLGQAVTVLRGELLV